MCLKLRLKLIFAFLMLEGSAFQSFGAAKANARSSYVQDIDRGTTSKPFVDERRLIKQVMHV